MAEEVNNLINCLFMSDEAKDLSLSIAFGSSKMEATAHITRPVIAELQRKFENKLLSRTPLSAGPQGHLTWLHQASYYFILYIYKSITITSYFIEMW